MAFMREEHHILGKKNWQERHVQILENFNENFNATKPSLYHFHIGWTNSKIQIFFFLDLSRKPALLWQFTASCNKNEKPSGFSVFSELLTFDLQGSYWTPASGDTSSVC